MRILIACEESATVRDEFAKLGHEAWSCDFKPSRTIGNHHQGDMRDVVPGSWDLVGFHPVCTYMNGAGIHWNNRGRGWEKTEASIEEVKWCMSHKIPWYLENPVGIISTRIRKPDQIIQPYEFGDDASKKTCLWLNKLPPLIKDPAKRFPGRWVEWPKGSGKMVERWGNQTDSGQNKLGPSDDRAEKRSKTYPGIAAEMAKQWSEFLLIYQNQTDRV